MAACRIPVAFRLWRTKRSCAPGAYQTKLQRAAQLLTELVAARLPFQYLIMDTHDTAGWLPAWPVGSDLLGRDPATQDHGHLARPPSQSMHPPTARCGWS
jgi:hypothetical protein